MLGDSVGFEYVDIAVGGFESGDFTEWKFGEERLGAVGDTHFEGGKGEREVVDVGNCLDLFIFLVW